ITACAPCAKKTIHGTSLRRATGRLSSVANNLLGICGLLSILAYGSTFRVCRRQVALCPIRKADESRRVQRVRGGNPRFAFWAEVRALLEVLERLSYFGRSREKRVVRI